MHYFFIEIAVGVCLISLLLVLFFTVGKKSRKQRHTDRELVLNLCDEGLIHLYEQAETDNEREGILEFVREKLAAEKNGSPASPNRIPALDLGVEQIVPPTTMPEPVKQVVPEPQLQVIPKITPQVQPQTLPEAVAQAPETVAQAQQEPEAITQPQIMPESVAMALTQAMPGVLDQTIAQPLPQAAEGERPVLAYGGGRQSSEKAAENSYTYASNTQTRELPLNKVDWAAIEEALEKKHEEDARMMAHNQLIQDVFSKIQKVENRVMGKMRSNDDL